MESSKPVVKIAPPPPQIIPKGIASEELLAHVAVAKFADSFPFYRQQAIFRWTSIDLDRSTMSGWMIQLTEQCKPIIALMKEKLRKGQVINTDETTLQVLGEKDRKNTSKSYVWIFRGGLLDAPVILRFSRHSKYGLKPIILYSILKPFWQKRFSMPLIKGIG